MTPTAEYQRKRRKKFRDAGLCLGCGKKCKGTYCQPCRKRECERVKEFMKDRYWMLKSHGLCVGCKQPTTNDTRCNACIKRASIFRKRSKVNE